VFVDRGRLTDRQRTETLQEQVDDVTDQVDDLEVDVGDDADDETAA